MATSQTGTATAGAVASGAQTLLGSTGTALAGLIYTISKSVPIFGGYTQFPSDLLNRSDLKQYTHFHCFDLNVMDEHGKQEEVNLGEVYLPLPAELTVPYRSNWQSQDMGAVATALQAHKGGSGAITDDVIKGGAYVAAQKILDGESEMNKLAQMVTKSVINPMKVLMWKAPDFRQFTFTYELTAKNGAEAESLNQIIYWFKRYIHTPSNAGDIVLKQPPLWRIKFNSSIDTSTSGNRFLFQVEDCAITAIDVDYTNKGIAFHRPDLDGDGEYAPNGVKLTISFTEMVILTQNSFGEAYPSGKYGKPTP